jgi:hypothetical protein
MFALTTIDEGSRIIEYTGELISEVEGERHTPANKRRFPCVCREALCRGSILRPNRQPATARVRRAIARWGPQGTGIDGRGVGSVEPGLAARTTGSTIFSVEVESVWTVFTVLSVGAVVR